MCRVDVSLLNDTDETLVELQVDSVENQRDTTEPALHMSMPAQRQAEVRGTLMHAQLTLNLLSYLVNTT